MYVVLSYGAYGVNECGLSYAANYYLQYGILLNTVVLLYLCLNELLAISDSKSKIVYAICWVTTDQRYIHEYTDRRVTVKNPIATCLHYEACLRMKERSIQKNTHTL